MAQHQAWGTGIYCANIVLRQARRVQYASSAREKKIPNVLCVVGMALLSIGLARREEVIYSSRSVGVLVSNQLFDAESS